MKTDIAESYRKAKRYGKTKYLAEAPCGACGDLVRYTCNQTCVPCSKARTKARYQKLKAALEAQ